MCYKPSAFLCINSVWLFRAGTAFLISSSKWRIPGSKLCLNGTAWAQALSEAGDIMFLSLIQHSNPTVAAVGDAELPALFSAWWGKPTGRAGVVATSGCWWDSPLPTTASPALSWGCFPAQSKHASAMEILILLGTWKAASEGASSAKWPKGQ